MAGSDKGLFEKLNGKFTLVLAVLHVADELYFYTDPRTNIQTCVPI